MTTQQKPSAISPALLAEIEQTQLELNRPVAEESDAPNPIYLSEAFDCICETIKAAQPLRWGELARALSKRTPKVWFNYGPVHELVRNMTHLLLPHTGHVIAVAVENRHGRWNRQFYSDMIDIGMLPANPTTKQKRDFRLVQWNWWRRKIAGADGDRLQTDFRALIDRLPVCVISDRRLPGD